MLPGHRIFAPSSPPRNPRREEAREERETHRSSLAVRSLIANKDFQQILRMLNTNINRKQNIMFALTSIKGIGEISAADLENLMTIVMNPRQFKITDWLLNRKMDYKDGRYSQVVSNAMDMKPRDDLERLKKIMNHRCLRHYWGLRVRGQHTKTTGRRGKIVGVSKKC